MMDKTSKTAGDYLQGLSAILHQVNQLKALNEHFKKFIPAEIADYCFVTNLINHKLIVLTANGSIATQIRFDSYDLIRKFKSDEFLKTVTQIETKVRPTHVVTKNTRKSQPVARLSEESAQMIEDIANSIEDETLKAALLRIATYKK